ncbi:hypothetical protein C8J57DRAFT_1347503, partial [Mycena rebaudengoi]
MYASPRHPSWQVRRVPRRRSRGQVSGSFQRCLVFILPVRRSARSSSIPRLLCPFPPSPIYTSIYFNAPLLRATCDFIFLSPVAAIDSFSTPPCSPPRSQHRADHAPSSAVRSSRSLLPFRPLPTFAVSSTLPCTAPQARRWAAERDAQHAQVSSASIGYAHAF